MANKKYYIGSLLLVLLSVSVYITLITQDLRIRVDNDKSTFYVKNDDNRWVVSGREYNKLFDGTSRMNRRLSSIKVDTVIDNVSTTVTIKRTTGFIRGPVIVDTYFFDGKLNDVELFPISHTVEIFNGSGFFYRYEVRDLIYEGITEPLFDISMEFGRRMKVTWEGEYRWARVFKSGILKVQYDIPTDYEIYNMRFFDPIRPTLVFEQRCEDNFVKVTDYGTCFENFTFIHFNNITRVPKDITNVRPHRCIIGSHMENQPICENIAVTINGRNKIDFKDRTCRLEGFILECVHNREGRKGVCGGENSGKDCVRIDIRDLSRSRTSPLTGVRGLKIEKV